MPGKTGLPGPSCFRGRCCSCSAGQVWRKEVGTNNPNKAPMGHVRVLGVGWWQSHVRPSGVQLRSKLGCDQGWSGPAICAVPCLCPATRSRQWRGWHGGPMFAHVLVLVMAFSSRPQTGLMAPPCGLETLNPKPNPRTKTLESSSASSTGPFCCFLAAAALAGLPAGPRSFRSWAVHGQQTPVAPGAARHVIHAAGESPGLACQISGAHPMTSVPSPCGVALNPQP